MQSTRSTNTGKRVDVANKEGTSKSLPRQSNQSDAQAEFVSQTYSTPPSQEELRCRRSTS